MTNEELEDTLTDLGFDDVVFFKDFCYDDALVGVSSDGRSVYDYNKMVEWLVKTQNFTEEEAVEWIDCNVLGGYIGERTPIVMYGLT